MFEKFTLAKMPSKDNTLLNSIVCGGAWPFLAGGMVCLVNSINERDLNLLTNCKIKRKIFFSTIGVVATVPLK